MAIDPVSQCLLRLEIFQGLRPLQITEIARLAERIIYKPGQVIIEDGAAGDAAVIVVGGEAVRTRAPLSANDIDEPIEPGSMLGEMAMLVETEYSSTVVARGAVRALRIPRETMLAMMLEDPALAEHLVAKVARRLHGIAEEMRQIEAIMAGEADAGASVEAHHQGEVVQDRQPAPPIAPRAPVGSTAGLVIPAHISPAALAAPTLNIVPQRF